uniref:Uncharacterized protein n=1 Tax=Oryza sativa subsp. japonica TaxID=39947 RepID=Q6ZFV6_ORYSJ|nr:hypothetical protein [Oryza sativa Japonica Group]
MAARPSWPSTASCRSRSVAYLRQQPPGHRRRHPRRWTRVRDQLPTQATTKVVGKFSYILQILKLDGVTRTRYLWCRSARRDVREDQRHAEQQEEEPGRSISLSCDQTPAIMQRKEQQRRARDAQLVGPSTQPGRLSKTLMSEYSNTEQIQVIEFCYSGVQVTYLGSSVRLDTDAYIVIFTTNYSFSGFKFVPK